MAVVVVVMPIGVEHIQIATSQLAQLTVVVVVMPIGVEHHARHAVIMG